MLVSRRKNTKKLEEIWMFQLCLIDGQMEIDILSIFLIKSLTDTSFWKSIDPFDTIKNRKLMFKYLDEVDEENGEENTVVQVIIDNPFN